MKPCRLPDDIDQLVTSAMICAWLSVPRQTFARLLSAGKFPAADMHLGRQGRWFKSRVENWIAQQARPRSNAK